MKRTRARQKLLHRARTLGALLAHFAGRHRFVLLPMLVILLLAGILLLLTGGLSYVTPFFYSLF